MRREEIPHRHVVLVLRKRGYSMPDNIDGGVVEYNWIFLPPNSNDVNHAHNIISDTLPQCFGAEVTHSLI